MSYISTKHVALPPTTAFKLPLEATLLYVAKILTRTRVTGANEGRCLYQGDMLMIEQLQRFLGYLPSRRHKGTRNMAGLLQKLRPLELPSSRLCLPMLSAGQSGASRVTHAPPLSPYGAVDASTEPLHDSPICSVKALPD